MKIIRPETPQKQEVRKEEITQTSIIDGFEHERHIDIRYEEPKKEENLTLVIDGKEVTPFTKDNIEVEFEPQSIEDIMNDVINNGTKNITFTITLTKKQYELWTKKGGEKWLKKALVGQARLTKKR